MDLWYISLSFYLLVMLMVPKMSFSGGHNIVLQ
jgi:hypothetical protein